MKKRISLTLLRVFTSILALFMFAMAVSLYFLSGHDFGFDYRLGVVAFGMLLSYWSLCVSDESLSKFMGGF
jgi:hypothetical protein